MCYYFVEQNTGRIMTAIPQQDLSSNLAGNASILLGDVESNNISIIATGSGSRAVSTIEKDLKIKFDPTHNFTEGSYIRWELSPGIYRMTMRFESLDNVNPDGILLLQDNGVFGELPEDGAILKSKELAEQLQTAEQELPVEFPSIIEVIHGNLIMVVLDAETKTNTSKVEVIELVKVKDGQELVVTSLATADVIGNFIQSEQSIEIGTGGGSRAISSIGRHLDFNLELETAIEGSVAKFDENFGIYRIYWEFETYEPVDSSKDQFYVWNGREFWSIANSSDATESVTASRRTTGIQITEVDVYETLGLFIVDTEDSRNTSTVKIYKVERVTSFYSMPFTAHLAIATNPLRIASKALISHEKQNNYELAFWQNEWQAGYNWYWHQFSPSGEENNYLAEEVQKMNFEQVLAENVEFRNSFLDIQAIAAQTLTQIYSFSSEIPSISVLDVAAAAQVALSVIRLHYQLASEIGLLNNTEPVSILQQIIPAYRGRLNVLVEQAQYFNAENHAYVQMPVEWIIAMIYKIAQASFVPEFIGFNHLYMLWKNSWGMD